MDNEGYIQLNYCSIHYSFSVMDAVDPMCVCYWHYTDGIQTHLKKQGHTVPSVTYFV